MATQAYKLNSKAFKSLVAEAIKNLYCHKISAQELKGDIEAAKEEKNRKELLSITKEKRILEEGLHYKKNEVDFNIRIINFLDEF